MSVAYALWREEYEKLDLFTAFAGEAPHFVTDLDDLLATDPDEVVLARVRDLGEDAEPNDALPEDERPTGGNTPAQIIELAEWVNRANQG